MPHGRRQGRVILHGEMQVKHPLLFLLLDPVLQEPMHRTLRIAVEPYLRPGNAAAASRLIYEGLRHQRDLVAVDTSKRHALNQILRGFIAATEDIEIVHALPVI